MRHLWLALVGLLVAFPAVAQVPGGDPSSGIPMRQDIRPLGVQMGHNSVLGMPAYIEADQCRQAGCIIVINKSPGYDITEFYLNDGKRDTARTPVWGENQFQGFALHYNRAVWTPKPGKMKCSLLVRVVMRDKDSAKTTSNVRPLSLCDMPKGGFAVLEVEASPKGEIIVGPGQAVSP
ncbi:hypothetical protein [Sphingomonas sp.]|uniref:hypothetical protein n=1 Tax=Sphingomonas sp. TaxID=28214 RepID=UPI001B152250|nr:hypothetical protein [Sphingomonas sp.]MBO9712139.1 hypothetical protein [Sphingomonas sp.]